MVNEAEMSLKSFRNVILENIVPHLLSVASVPSVIVIFRWCRNNCDLMQKKKKGKKSENCSCLLNIMGVIVLEFSLSFFFVIVTPKKD